MVDFSTLVSLASLGISAGAMSVLYFQMRKIPSIPSVTDRLSEMNLKVDEAVKRIDKIETKYYKHTEENDANFAAINVSLATILNDLSWLKGRFGWQPNDK